MIQRHSMVLEVEVQFDGEPHTAAYFVERDVIHAQVGDRVIVTPLLGTDPAETVKTQLLAHLGSAGHHGNLCAAPMTAAVVAPHHRPKDAGQSGGLQSVDLDHQL